MKRFIPVLLFALLLFAVPRVEAASSAVIQNDTSYLDPDGYFHVFGEVRNTGDVWLQFVTITGTLTNSSGQIVDVINMFTNPFYLPPSQNAPFNLFEADKARSAKISMYLLALQFSEAANPPQPLLIIQGAIASTDSIGHMNIFGQVFNNGPQVSNYTQVIATFYDSAGKVIYVDSTFTSPATIPSMDAQRFNLLGPPQPVSSRVASWNLIAESTQYTSIPEYPSPAILLVVGLSLAIVAMRKKRT